jgi:hypothetical protein
MLMSICLKITLINKQFPIVEDLRSQNARLSNSIKSSVKSVVKVNSEEKRQSYKIIMPVIFSSSWTIMAVKSFQPRALVKSHWIQIQLSAHHLTSSP